MLHLKSRPVFAIMALLTACSAWAQAFYINGHKAVQDSLNGIWLCSIPQEIFGTDWEASIAADSTWTEFMVNDVNAIEGQVTFVGIAGGKLYPFTAVTGDTTITGNITFTWLPVLELNGDFGYDYAEGTVSLSAPDTTENKDDMLAKLKWRGGITNTANKHKRNYHIKFLDETGEKKNRRLLGMRKDNHWKLDAGQIDPLRIRNRVCSDLWLDMSRHPWHYENDPTIINGSRGQVTEVILNGKYHGIYGLIEPVDRKQLGLIKHDTINNEFHGQQWVSKEWARTYTFPTYNNNSPTWNKNEVNYPEMEDVSPTDWSTIYSAFDFARRVDGNDDWATLADSLDYYFDMPTMEDYFIFIATVQALDNEVKNIYYSCYDKALGAPRLTMTAWDVDVSLGAKSIQGLTDALVRPDRGLDWISHLAMNDMFYHSAPHRKDLIKRYWQLRETCLNTDSLIARFRTAVDELEMSGAAAREEARWSKDSDINGKVLDISAEMEYVAKWIRRRMEYLDGNIFVPDPIVLGDVNADGRLTISDVTLLISYLCKNEVYIDEDNSDVNGDGEINITDLTSLITKLLNGE